MTALPSKLRELQARITDCLAKGGLFNMEVMEAGKVTDLLIDCRHALEELEKLAPPSAESLCGICGMNRSYHDPGLVSHAFRPRINAPSQPSKLEALNAAFRCAYIECPAHVIDDLKRRFDEYLAEMLAAAPVAKLAHSHGLVNELEREIIRLNEELTAVWGEHTMYMNAWCREIGGFIRRKAHQIDGYVLRTRDALKEQYEKGKQDARDGWTGRDKWIEDVGKSLCGNAAPPPTPGLSEQQVTLSADDIREARKNANCFHPSEYSTTGRCGLHAI